MRKSWKFIGLLAISAWLVAVPALAFPEIKPGFPRLANYFLHWTISEQEARELAKWDLLILDMETQYRSREALELLRQLNPKIILLAYLTPVEIRKDAAVLAEVAPLRFKLARDYLKAQWYLTDAAQKRRSFWPGTEILNITQRAPVVEGRRWSDVLPVFVTQEILQTGLWDGVFFDNGWGDPSHHTGVNLDLDRDGKAETVEEVNQEWIEGMKILLRKTRARLQDRYLLMINGNAAQYAREVNGVLFEYFPREGWPATTAQYVRSSQENLPPSLAVVNRLSATGGIQDYPGLRFGLASALLGDGHYSFDYGITDHGQIWYYDEYSVFLGEPLGEPRSYDKRRPFAPGLWRRDFENGVVLVNAGEEARKVYFPVEVEKIRGSQDAQVNDGALVRLVTVAAQDGTILLRPLQVIFGAPYENGIFARVFNARGEVTRAGFFAFDRQERSGVTLAVVDMDGDGKREKIKRSEKGEALGIGDVTGEGVKEIVIAVNGQVRVERLDGSLVTPPFFPFGSRYRGSLNVAVGDLNGDGFSEIVVGAGPGGGPQVRIFSGQGRLLSGGFFAYDPRFRGGVRVSVGDVDGDRIAEIVTGPGPGGGPQVRIFNSHGQPVSAGFFAFERASREGVTPLVTDVDGDGKSEIVAVVREVLE